MATVVRGSVSQLLQRDLDSIFIREANLADQAETRFLLAKSTTDDRYESRQIVGPELPTVKTEGADIAFSSITQLDAVTLTVQTVAGGLVISMEALQDCRYGMIMEAVGDLGRLIKYKRLQDAASTWNNAVSATVLGRDAVALCSTAHVLVDGSTTGNRPSTDAALSIASLESALIALRKQVDERGNKIPAIGGIVLHVPADLEFTGYNILNAAGRPGVFSNDINAVQKRGLTLEVDDFLTGTARWFLQVREQHKCVWVERMAPWTVKGGDFDSQDSKFAALTRYIYGFESWRGVYGNSP